ncbi:hypothetical protein EJ05DRAFT_476756 [Pseudovirgaria hyperparasitica]|uniref:RRM domain-containing protein n=1 Tax=Pseudovirgaria hyperparasitica TaxID=470096 RepID=A0A6A6W4F8_9PEZI|nr:uncharacterized protein EJ05DRAFT_476756 [Pseudovirgaria hyperparasitica]KAF2757503.1 hypothetical protein EJ05DRAFT_476756 [Pseudovirgaria hyperparasitica]
MADEDQFDIDIYGDDGNQDYNQEGQADSAGPATDGETMTDTTQPDAPTNGASNENSHAKQDEGQQANTQSVSTATQQIASTGEGAGQNQVQLPKHAPIQQGTKRKEGADDRPMDPGATSALLIQELHWWSTEDDIRGWANQAECEDELKDITFNEHKVNGKSKGQVYVEMQTAQAATALKHKIESFGDGQQHVRKPIVTFNPPHINPYKTLPKDVPNRKDYKQDSRGGGNFGAGRGGFQNRGGFNNNRGNMNNNFQSRNFTPPMGMNQNFNNPMSFNNNMGAGNFGGNFNRGGMMGGGMRGGMQNNRGRGGMSGMTMGAGMNNMGGMGMNAMNMGGMPMGGGIGNNMMGGMGMGMGGGFGGNQGHFNPAFFSGGQQAGGDGQWNPHGNKRPRPE